MLEKNISKVNYKVSGDMIHSSCINKTEYISLTNDFNNLSFKYKTVEDKLIEVFDENKDLYEKNRILQEENILLKEKNEKIDELEKYVNDFISFSVEYNINNIDELKDFILNKSEFIMMI